MIDTFYQEEIHDFSLHLLDSRFGADLLSRHLERDVAERSQLIKNMLEDLGETGEPIPIPNVSHLGSAMRLTFQSTLHDGNSLTRCRSTKPF